MSAQLDAEHKPCPDCGGRMSRHSARCWPCHRAALIAEREARDALPTKLCPRCGATKPLAAFAPRGRARHGGRRYGYCKPCAIEYQRTNKRRLVFNVTDAEAQAILDHQGGGCAICGRAAKNGGLSLSLDHDHKTGLVRGRLCWLCNKALGAIRDDPARLQRMIDYLSNPPAVAALGEHRYGRKGRSTNKVRRRS